MVYISCIGIRISVVIDNYSNCLFVFLINVNQTDIPHILLHREMHAVKLDEW